MGQLKIKPPKKPLNIRRMIQGLEALLNQTGLMARLIYPPIAPEEDARARFVATSLLTELNKPDGTTVPNLDAGQIAARHRVLVVSYMFQMCVAGVINFMNAEKLKVKPAPAREPLTNAEHEIVKNTLAASGYKFEEKS